MRRRIRRLSTQFFVAQLVILTTATAIGFVLFAVTARQQLDRDFQTRAAVIAESVAEDPDVQTCMDPAAADASCPVTLESIATTTAKRTGAAYVVLIDPNRVRRTHPDPALIGQKISEPVIAADGKNHLGVDVGATGVTANARVPLYSAGGTFLGEVSVGILEDSVSSELLAQLPSYAAWFLVMFAVGTVASLVFANRLKRRTFGLELDEIAELLQEREATLRGIREGVVAVDARGRITVVNDVARLLLHLPEDAEGHAVADIVPAGPVREVLTGDGELVDEVLLTADYWLVVNRRPVRFDRRAHGTVVTVQDRTMFEGVVQELAGERSLTDSMRAQQHEFSNRLHAIAGLLELGRTDEALAYLHEVRGIAADLDLTLRRHIEAPAIVGLLLGKSAEASERGIELTLEDDSVLGTAPEHVAALTTVIGNLVDNAFDALSGTPAPRRVRVSIVEGPDGVRVRVGDSGPGVARADAPHIFRKGYSTKRGSLVRHSGLGLALVQDTVRRLGGTVEVSEGPGATFTVELPKELAGSSS